MLIEENPVIVIIEGWLGDTVTDSVKLPHSAFMVYDTKRVGNEITRALF